MFWYLSLLTNPTKDKIQGKTQQFHCQVLTLAVEEFTLGATVMGVYENDGTPVMSCSVRLSAF